MKISKNLALLLATCFTGVIGFSGCGSESSTNTKAMSETSTANGEQAAAKSDVVPLAMTASARRTFVVNEINSYNSFITDSTIKTNKYTEMGATPFTFYRATAHLYFKDLSNGTIVTPSSWATTANIKTWIQGDMHTQNVGFFDNKNGTVKFDLNDFDESYMAPFYWDLIRFGASIYLMQGETGFNLSDGEADTIVSTFLAEYQSAIDGFAGNDSELGYELTASNTSGIIKDKIDKLKSDYTVAKLLDKWTVVTSGARKFNFTNPDLKTPDATKKTGIVNAWSSYKTQAAAASSYASYFNIKDVAQRMNSGLGSQGVEKYYVLIEGPSTSTSDDVILEVKEQRLPSMFYNSSMSQTSYNTLFSSHATRTVTATKALQSNADNHLGAISANSKKYSVKKISQYKYGFDAADFTSKSDLTLFATYCAKALAADHSRADKDYNTGYISYGFDKGASDAIKAWSNAKSTMQSLAKSYATQVKTDYAYFKDARTKGEIK